uniref:Mitochondrial import inner membrane translocase subunit TIM44 n=1 Tax=Ciona savignyi TaxID=51511 RepID=H2Z0R5_CIOSA
MYSLRRLASSTALRRGILGAGTEVKSDSNFLDARVLLLCKNVEVQRDYSNKRSFLENFVETIKQEYNKDPELKESIKKFREEAKELEDSEALKQARKKFKEIEKETSQNTEILQETFGKIKSKVSETAEDLSASEVGKAAGRFSEGISDAARRAADSEALKKVQSSFNTIAQGTGVAPESLYQPPSMLRMRKQEFSVDSEREFQANTEATNVVMHKDSVWNQQWESFKTSKVGESISEMKMRFDESDNFFVRGSRFLTDKISGVAGSLLGGTDISKVMTEISKIDPEFSAQGFLDFCRFEVIPNLLEAIAQGNDKIVKDWCSEAPYNQLMFPAKQAQQIGCKYELTTVDLDHIDIAGATKVDQGPVLVISFQTQQIMVVRNKKGEVVEGNSDQIMRVYHVWALCRDIEELDRMAAWKIIDQSMSASPMLL